MPKVELQISIYGVKILDPKTKVCTRLHMITHVYKAYSVNSVYNPLEHSCTAQQPNVGRAYALLADT